jgi:hypothetical protein
MIPIACPFCPNAEPSVQEVDMGVWAVCCDQCNCTGPISDFGASSQTREQAVANWNNRSKPS